jgi:hypothetical protein
MLHGSSTALGTSGPRRRGPAALFALSHQFRNHHVPLVVPMRAVPSYSSKSASTDGVVTALAIQALIESGSWQARIRER